jgi:Spy/CpxP family protein refolding chaperone
MMYKTSKNWMKNSALLLGMAVSLSAGVLLAQQTDTPAAQTAQSASVTAHMGGKLQLTVEQKKQLRELRQSARDQAAIIRNDQTLTPEQRMAKLKELHASTHAQMKAVLTPAQQTQFENMRAARRERIAAKLGLTPEQQNKLKDLFVSNREQRQSVLQNAALSNDQKAAQLKQIRETSKTQLEAILSPQQLAQFEQMRHNHRHSRMD